MERYSVIENKNPREIVLLKGKPCFWGKCTFCDYIEDNSTSEAEIDKINQEVLTRVNGKYSALEIINSGNVFELTPATLDNIKQVCKDKGIDKLTFESHWAYHERLDEIRRFFDMPIIFKCGIETFDDNFRNNVLIKGAYFSSPEEVAKYMDSICLLVGVKGQTKQMIAKDIENLLTYFKYGCVNVFTPNSTAVEPDYELISWFREEYSHIDNLNNIDVLWNNTDFGVGGETKDENNA